MAWHRDSIGILIQRFFFTLLIFISVLVFNGCVDDSTQDDLQVCFRKTSIPLAVSIIIIFLKIFCLKKQRILLWGGFLVCVIAQLMVLCFVDGEFITTYTTTTSPRQLQQIEEYFDNEITFGTYGAPSNDIKQVLMFSPCLIFGLMVDLQILESIIRYEPVAFSEIPHRAIKPILISLGLISLITSLLSIILAIFVFGNLTSEPTWRKTIFSTLMFKAITWSPFFGIELYDTFFE